MTTNLDGVLLEIDSRNNVLRVWRHFAAGKSSPFRLIEIPLTDLGMADKLTAESHLGGVVLSALADAHPALAVFRAEIAPQDAVDLAPSMVTIEALARSGDPNAQNAQGMLLYDRSLELLRTDLLEEAEHWFRAAANSGEESAVKFLESWPKVKQHRLDEIARQSSSKGQG